MTWSLYALLNDDVPAISNESLAEEIKAVFRSDDKFSLEFEHMPFEIDKNLALRWNSWLVRVYYEQGETVLADSVEIQKMTASFSSCDVSDVSRRIRVVFGRDDEREYTNEIILIMEFLERLAGNCIFDPQQKDFVA